MQATGWSKAGVLMCIQHSSFGPQELKSEERMVSSSEAQKGDDLSGMSHINTILSNLHNCKHCNLIIAHLDETAARKGAGKKEKGRNSRRKSNNGRKGGACAGKDSYAAHQGQIML